MDSMFLCLSHNKTQQKMTLPQQPHISPQKIPKFYSPYYLKIQEKESSILR